METYEHKMGKMGYAGIFGCLPFPPLSILKFGDSAPLIERRYWIAGLVQGRCA